MKLFYKLKNVCLDVLFPPICLNCRTNLSENEKNPSAGSGQVPSASSGRGKICQKCLDSIFVYSSFFCAKCKARIPDGEKICHKEMKFILAATTSYQNDATKNIVKFLKYNKWKGLVLVLKPFMEKYLNMLSYNFNGFIVIPIPLHPDRQKERGFNQSELIAEIFCQKTGATLERNFLKRTKITKIQAELKNIEERKKNVENCFELINPVEIKNKNIVLVDDVFTTGSTIGEAAEVLKKTGAKKIIAFVFAKA